MKLAYDADADVLYVTFEETTGPCSYVENSVGDILRIDIQKQRIVGCTIPFFSTRYESGETIDVPEVGAVPINESGKRLLHIER